MWAHEPVYYTTFLVHVVFVFGVHEKGFDGVVAFEVHLDAQAVVGLLEPFPTSFCVWDHDDTFVIQQAKYSQQLLQQINSQEPHIQFITEELNQEGALPFLDTLVSPGPNNTLVTTVYRKPTHTDQYLPWDSNHIIAAKKVSSGHWYLGQRWSAPINTHYNSK